jgi:hypothetical protein
MSPSQQLPPKKDVALALLERSTMRVFLDPRPVSVTVPPWLKKQPQLLLEIGLNMPVPVRDLRVDDDGMSCTLSFNRAPFFCVLPWSSIFALVDSEGRGMVWPDDAPPEVPRQGQARSLDAADRPAPKPAPASEPKIAAARSNGKKPRKRPALSAADGEVIESSKPELPDAPEGGEPVDPPSSPARPAVMPAPPSRPSLGGAGLAPGRKRRELPPYLRVVK